MPRSHGVIKNEIWAPVSDFRQLDLDPQWAYVMLISQPQINNLGLLPYLPDKWLRLAHDLTDQRLQNALNTLEQHHYTITDTDTGELLVRTFIRHDGVWKQPKLVTSARRLWREVESDMIRHQLVQQHPWLADDRWTPQRIRHHEERPTHPPRRTPETPPDTPRERSPETPPATPSETPSETPTAAEGVTEPLNDGVRARVRDGLPQNKELLGSISQKTTTRPPTDAAASEQAEAVPEPDVVVDDHQPKPDVGELDRLLDQLAVHGRLRDLAHTDPERAAAVARYTLSRGQRGGYWRRVFESGNWPTEPPAKLEATAVNQPPSWQPGQPLRYLDQARVVWSSLNGDGRAETAVWLAGFTDDPAEIAAHLDVLEQEFPPAVGVASGAVVTEGTSP